MTSPCSDPDDDLIALADWRRRIADLYATVRERGPDRVEESWALWVAARESLYRGHSHSPVPRSQRDGFRARHWPYDPALRFLVCPTPDGDRPDEEGGLALPVSNGATMAFSRIGWFDIPFEQGPERLALYWMSGYAGGLFLPFREATNGAETYGAGRYLLDSAKGADLGGDDEGRLVLDFNFAYQPSCAFDPRWACPLAPLENLLDIAIRAGERIA